MIPIAIVAALGLGALLLVNVFFTSRRSERLATVRRTMDEEISTVLHRADQVDQTLVEALERGVSMDQALSEYRTTRSDLFLTHDKTADAYKWDADDLHKWKTEELRRRGEEINRKMMVPALATSLLIIAVTVTVAAVMYHFNVSRSSDAAPSVPHVLSDQTLPPALPATTQSPAVPSAAPAPSPPADQSAQP